MSATSRKHRLQGHIRALETLRENLYREADTCRRDRKLHLHSAALSLHEPIGFLKNALDPKKASKVW